jgi:ABC-2 type transport system permease protein
VTTATYTRLEILRTFRNRRFFILSLGFPIVLFYVVAGTNRHAHIAGISLPRYYMVGMASWGAMAAAMAGGARIALERSVGWTRQMRITPLPVPTYFRTKVLSSYLMAVVSLLLLAAAGLSLGVRLPFSAWFETAGLMLVGIVPFVVLGILLGHLLTVDSMGPALGGIVALFALLGGAWGPLSSSGTLHDVVQLLPSYWLVEAGKLAVGGHGWPAKAWIVIALWSAVLLRLTVRVYRRDTARA